MHDIAHFETLPLVAVTRDITKLGDLIGVLSQASNVIELQAQNDTYRKYARAA
jgi:hypothetical protein